MSRHEMLGKVAELLCTKSGDASIFLVLQTMNYLLY